MNYYDNSYQSAAYGPPDSAALAGESERTAFLRKTYLHLAGAVGLFVLIEFVLLTVVPETTLNAIMQLMIGNRFSWLIVLGGFMAISALANYWAQSNASRGLQYAGLGLYVVGEAIIFLPLLYIAEQSAPSAIGTAAVLTLVTFGGLTAVVLFTGADFSWTGRYLCWAGLLGLGVIVCAIVFKFQLGVWFSAAMVGLASGYILYYTSNVLHNYRTDQYVAASLALFASVALLFWYILRLVMASRR